MCESIDVDIDRHQQSLRARLLRRESINWKLDVQRSFVFFVLFVRTDYSRFREIMKIPIAIGASPR